MSTPSLVFVETQSGRWIGLQNYDIQPLTESAGGSAAQATVMAISASTPGVTHKLMDRLCPSMAEAVTVSHGVARGILRASKEEFMIDQDKIAAISQRNDD